MLGDVSKLLRSLLPARAKRFGKRETMLLVPAFNEWSKQV
jgi:hypothetical protein